MIYHKFSHGATFYTLNGKNVHIMLEFYVKQRGWGRSVCDRRRGALDKKRGILIRPRNNVFLTLKSYLAIR